jgi:hypothetical protein
VHLDAAEEREFDGSDAASIASHADTANNDDVWYLAVVSAARDAFSKVSMKLHKDRGTV